MQEATNPRLRPPVSSNYYPSILKALGDLTKRQANVFVSHLVVLDRTIRNMGFDPDNLSQYGDPALGWRRGGNQAPPGMDRIIYLAMRNLSWRTTPLCVYGPQDGVTTRLIPTCQWGLTEAGVKALPELKPEKSKPNLTSRFLSERLSAPGGIKQSELYRTMKVTLGKKLPISNATGQIDDHIQQCFARLISRDALRKWLETEKDVSNNNLASFAVFSAFTDCRDSARNPICRTLYGAKTEKELQPGGPEINCYGTGGDTKVVRKTNRDNDAVIYEIVDMKPTAEEGLMFAAIWEEIVDTLKRKKPATWQRYAKVIALKAEGHSVEEIQTLLGLPDNRVSSLLSEARDVLRMVGKTRGFESFNLFD